MKETFYRYEMPVKQPAADAVAADLGRFNGEGEDFYTLNVVDDDFVGAQSVSMLIDGAIQTKKVMLSKKVRGTDKLGDYLEAEADQLYTTVSIEASARCTCPSSLPA